MFTFNKDDINYFLNIVEERKNILIDTIKSGKDLSDKVFEDLDFHNLLFHKLKIKLDFFEEE